MAGPVLVTGGAGFIGSHLVELLLGSGYTVRVLDNLTFGHRDWLPARIQFVEGDIRDMETCRQACAGVEGVFHLAAMSRSAASLEHLDICTTNNVVGTQNVLIAARDAGVRKVVYSGSSTYYGSRPVPHSESTPPDFLNLYGLSKHVGSEYCLLFDRLYDLPAVVLRYFNVYGPRQPVEGAYALLMGIFLRNWIRGLPLAIHGTGQQRRDFVHVRDVARANLMAYESDVRSEVFNVGSGTNVSVKELADLISTDQIQGPGRRGDSAETLADIDRIRKRLGWEPQVSFAAALQELKQFMKDDPRNALRGRDE